MSGAAPTFAGWSLALTMVALCGAILLRGGRRRAAINEALHELRRPLQALALFGTDQRQAAIESSVQLAGAALERLDREVNGGGLEPPRETLRAEAAARSAVGRWRARVALDGGELELRWRAGDARLDCDPAAVEQAIDNLIVNAIEHGGPRIAVEGIRRGRWLRVAVADSGRSSRPSERRETTAEAIARISGRRRRGHGLAVVRRVAARHGGRFVLRVGDNGSIAVLDLPLAASRAELGA